MEHAGSKASFLRTQWTAAVVATLLLLGPNISSTMQQCAVTMPLLKPSDS
jgi:hypothetical protein